MKTKMKKPKKPNLNVQKLLRRHKDVEEQGLPRITNETVAEHREQVLSSARKYIYPLEHSKHRIVVVSIWLFSILFAVFVVYVGLALYKFQSTSTFVYGVTRVVPFPVAKAGSHYVSYESYLFELKHYLHYYETQQRVDFKSESGKEQLAEFKRRSLNQVITDSYVTQLAKKNHISVNQAEVNDEVALVRSQNRLGGSDQVFQDVLQKFWGWSEDDFKRELSNELLQQKVVDKLDTATHNRANQALVQLQGGADFATVAKQASDDASTRDNGGDYGIEITRTNRDIAPQVTEELFKLKPGEVSPIINTGFNLEILKVTDVSGDKVHASHISFNFKDISAFTNPLQKQHPAHRFIGVK